MKKYGTSFLMLSAFLLIGAGCQTRPETTAMTLEKTAFTQEESQIAQTLGYTADPLVCQFTADSKIASIHYAVYELQNEKWEKRWDQDQESPGTGGRISVFTDQLAEGVSIIMQCNNICVKDQLQMKNPDFTANTALTLNTAVMDSDMPLAYSQEIPLIFQLYSDDLYSLAYDADLFHSPEKLSDDKNIWVLTVTFISGDNRKLPPIQ